MPTQKKQAEFEKEAAIHDGVGHPVRVAMLHALREKPEMTSAELGRAVSESYTSIDSRRLQFHLYKMQTAGLITTRKAGRGDIVTLVRDVLLRTKEL